MHVVGFPLNLLKNEHHTWRRREERGDALEALKIKEEKEERMSTTLELDLSLEWSTKFGSEREGRENFFLFSGSQDTRMREGFRESEKGRGEPLPYPIGHPTARARLGSMLRQRAERSGPHAPRSATHSAPLYSCTGTAQQRQRANPVRAYPQT